MWRTRQVARVLVLHASVDGCCDSGDTVLVTATSYSARRQGARLGDGGERGRRYERENEELFEQHGESA